MRGLSSKTLERIAFARRLLAEFHPMTLRQLHYAIFSAARIAYDNTPEDYKRLSPCHHHGPQKLPRPRTGWRRRCPRLERHDPARLDCG
jgi:hypothetical protein